MWDWLSSLHSHDFELNPECSFTFRRTILPINRHQPVLHNSFKGGVTSSQSHGFELTNQRIESHHLARLPSTASRSTTSKYSSNLAPSYPATSVSANSLDHGLGVYLWVHSVWVGLQLHLQTHSITASKCISEFTRPRPPSASPNSLDHGLPVHLQTRSIMASKCISQFTPSRPPSSSPKQLNHGLQVYRTRSITTFKCISEFTWPQPPSASPNSVDHILPVHLWFHSISISNCVSKPTRLWPWRVSLGSFDRHFQAQLESLSRPACCQSRYTGCRWVAIWIHRHIDENTNWIHEF